MKLTSVIYKTALKTYEVLPFKKQLCELVRYLRINHEKFYKDVRFKEPFKVQLKNGQHFKLYHGSTIESDIFWKGLGNNWESDTIWIVEELARTSDVIFDIGANVGVYSLISKTVNPSAKVYSFEPVKRTHGQLLKNMAVNNYNIVAEQIALSDKTGTQLFYDVESEHQQSASLSADKFKTPGDCTDPIIEYNITTSTLDEYIDKNNITNIDLIKIDVELHEPAVIAGFTKYLEIFSPYIVIEVLNSQVANELNKVFANGNYKIFHLDESNVLRPKDRLEVIPFKWNFLICKPEKLEQVSKFITY
ncbi:MAG TPA: FkbM family methyltransferase [Chitinophagales bacterium]|nr:FkbM family methyltransferase [Chitinophagales bacterium]